MNNMDSKKQLNLIQEEINKLNLKLDVTNLTDSMDLVKLDTLTHIINEQTKNYINELLNSFFHSYNDIIDIIPEKDFHKWKVNPINGHLFNWKRDWIERGDKRKILNNSVIKTEKVKGSDGKSDISVYTDFMGCDDFIDKLRFVNNGHNDAKIFLIDYERKIINSSNHLKPNSLLSRAEEKKLAEEINNKYFGEYKTLHYNVLSGWNIIREDFDPILISEKGELYLKVTLISDSKWTFPYSDNANSRKTMGSIETLVNIILIITISFVLKLIPTKILGITMKNDGYNKIKHDNHPIAFFCGMFNEEDFGYKKKSNYHRNGKGYPYGVDVSDFDFMNEND